MYQILDKIKKEIPKVGSTLTGKVILKEKRRLFVDLENIAHHKGSAFGSINEQKQNPQQVFEHQLYHQLNRLELFLKCGIRKTILYQIY